MLGTMLEGPRNIQATTWEGSRLSEISGFRIAETKFSWEVSCGNIEIRTRHCLRLHLKFENLMLGDHRIEQSFKPLL